MYSQWIAYHSEREGLNQQDIWIDTMKALQRVLEKARELSGGTLETTPVQDLSVREL